MRINLLPPEERPLKPSAVRWEFLVSLAGLLFLMAVLVFSWLGTNKVKLLTLDYEQALAYEARLQTQVQRVQALKDEIGSLEAEEKEYSQFLEKEETLRVIPLLAEHPFSKVWLERVAWNEKKIEVVGYSGKQIGLSQYLNYLKEHSEEALASGVEHIAGTDFLTFRIEVRGLGIRDKKQIY